MPYLGNSPKDISNRSKISTFRYNATANQSSFGGADSQGNRPVIAPENIVVTVNGVVMEPSTDYTANTTHITLVTPAALNDDVNILSLDVYNLSDIPKLTGNNTFTGDINVTSNTFVNNLTFYDGSQATTSKSFGFRNRIINGKMEIDQRRLGEAISITNTLQNLTVDNWTARGMTSSGVFTIQRANTSAPIEYGFAEYLRANVTTANTTIAPTGLFAFITRIEGNNMEDFKYGTANAETTTLSFYARSSVTGNHSVTLVNAIDNLTTYATFYTINSSNTWEYKTITIPGATIGTWAANNVSSLAVIFSLGTGSTYTTTTANTNTWITASVYKTPNSVDLIQTLNATLDITGVQLELGDRATPFEHRPFQQELILCQRYLPALIASSTIDSIGSGVDATATSGNAFIPFLVPTRVPVTGLDVISAGHYRSYNGGTVTVTGLTFGGLGTSVNGTTIGWTSASGGTAGRGNIFYSANNRARMYFTGAGLHE